MTGTHDDSHDESHDDTATLTTTLTELLSISHPILLAPMGGSAGGRLAAAVSNAGGLGLIGGGYGDEKWLATELELAAGSRVGVGFITFGLDEHPGALHSALRAAPAAIQLSFGDPRPYADDIHAAGAFLICQVQSAEEVELAVDAGADVIIAQGQDSGGHGRPDRATMGLVPSVVDRVAPLPVVAAGGIADGRGLAAALMLGATGITMGTRFLATPEAMSNPAEAAALVGGRADATVRTPVFDAVRGPSWPEGHDARAVRNELVDEWEQRGDLDELRKMYASAPSDDVSVRPVWAGEGLDLVTSVLPAQTIVQRVVGDAARCIAGAQALLGPRPAARAR